ncbi:MAG: B12-binding domain-containing radical SAM protein [Nitrospirae bacterium]|nr:B12-binding domain-containing radical SAM protein [Nitrospirota bacterium]
MRDPKVLLIYPPPRLLPIETPRPDGSLGMLYLAGALRQIGIEADLLDTSIGGPKDTLEDTFYRNVQLENGLTQIGMSWDRIAEAAAGYDIVGIHSNHTSQTKASFKVAEIVKRVNPKALVIAGGISARALWQRFVDQGTFDLICTSEGERTIQEIAQRFRQGQRYQGICGTLGNPPHFHQNLDELPFPTWDKLLLDKYEQIAAPHGVDLTGQQYRYQNLMTSRGCPFQCAYCHISKERFNRSEEIGNVGALRLKSVDRVLQEIEVLQSLGVKKIFIEDDSLLAKKARIISIFKAIQGKDLLIADVNGVNLVHLFKRTANGLEPDKEYLQLLFSAGLRQIVFPVESGSQRVIDKYATGKLTLETMDVISLIRVAKSVGMICPINIMIGFPDETEQEMMMSIELSKRLIDAGTDYVTFFIPIPFPGSQLYDIAIENGHLRPDFDTDIMNYKNGVMENTTVPKERIVALRDWAWTTVNSKEHIAKRLQESMGARWQEV